MDLRLLRRIPLLRAVPEPALRRIARISKTWDFPAGANIFAKAAPATHLFLVLEGRVKVFTHLGAKKRKTFAYFGAGRFFGEMALLDGRERSASAQAVEDSRLLLIHRRDFINLVLHDAKLACFLLRVLSGRLRRANEEIESLLFRNILGRVAKALHDLGKTSGKRLRGGVLLDHAYTHQELADIVGTTREPLSRALASLRRADLISTRDGRFFMNDPKRIQLLVGEPQRI